VKIALLLSGFPRNFKYTFPYFKKYVLEDLHPDIFYFGYNDLASGTTTDDILYRYKPKKYCIRKASSEIDEEIWRAYGAREIGNGVSFSAQHNSPHRILSQYYNLLKVNELKTQAEEEGGFKYDCVIRARPDYFFYTNIEKDALLKIKSNHVYIPDVWDFTGICDMFAYGDSPAIDKYCDIFSNVKRYILQDHCVFLPEALLKFHILLGEKMNREVIKNPFWYELSDFEIQGVSSSLINKGDVKRARTRTEFA
jgi:hypothetical protein